MSSPSTEAPSRPLVAIACGGTGGHTFPGLAVGSELAARGCDVLLLVSQKEVDHEAVKSALDMQIVALPAVGLTRRRLVAFALGFWKSYLAARRLFRQRVPQAVLSMGGFTSAPPVLSGKAAGAVTFLHESNTIPGKANRWLAHYVDQAFVGFPSTASRLHCRRVVTTGTPVRAQFLPADPAGCRTALGLDPGRPLLLVMGGSQGARGVNQLVLGAVPGLLQAAPDLQFLHLTGPGEFGLVKATYEQCGCRALVRAFLTEMELAMGAATVAVSRAGASSLAELAAMRLPAILVPYPHAADNHQLVNAHALVDAGAALLLEQKDATGEKLASQILKLVQDDVARSAMSHELARWHSPRAAAQIAEKILARVSTVNSGRWPADETKGSTEPPPARNTQAAVL
jgi:UDP-N-acetylglucosamine--N-acetylmuramyl-(pentapeptide) pyrophosphoryl-undecaprenol N-acetylglucosamine transferase